MLVSIVVIFYNQKPFVRRALRSVVRQTYSEMDIIVVDDGSEEDISAEVARFEDSRVRFFSKENGGPASARNFGIRQARGIYIAFLDGDDVFLPQKIERMVSFLDFLQPFANSLEQVTEPPGRSGVVCPKRTSISTPSESSLPSSSGSGCGQSPLSGQGYPVCIVTSDAYVVDEKNRLAGRIRSREYASGEIIDTALLRPSCTLYHKGVFEKTGRFPEVLKTGEDGAFNILATQLFPVFRISEPLTLYRMDESGLARRHLADYEEAVARTRARVDFVNSRIDTHKASEYERLTYRGLLYGFLSAGNLEAARKWSDQVNVPVAGFLAKISIRSGVNFYLFARRVRRGLSRLLLLPVQVRLR